VITGQPALDDLALYRQRNTAEHRLALREALGISPSERLLLFASQPIAEVFGSDPGRPSYLGYTEHTVLNALVPALETIAKRDALKMTMLIRPHPREQKRDLESWRSDYLRILVSADGDGRELAMASDLVMGMTSMLLLEACLLGCLIASLQPGLRAADSLPTNRTGLSKAIYRETEIEPVIERLLCDDEVRGEALARLGKAALPEGATQSVARLIRSMF